MIDLYQFLTKGSKNEQVDKANRDIDFYYNKFNSCSDIELNDILKIYNEYPIEAQKALSKIKMEKGIS